MPTTLADTQVFMVHKRVAVPKLFDLKGSPKLDGKIASLRETHSSLLKALAKKLTAKK